MSSLKTAKEHLQKQNEDLINTLKEVSLFFSYFFKCYIFPNFTVVLNGKVHRGTQLILIHSRSRNSRSPWRKSSGMSWMPILSFPIFTRYFWFPFWHTFFRYDFNLPYINDRPVTLLKLNFCNPCKNGIVVHWWTSAVCRTVIVIVRAFPFVLLTFNFFFVHVLTGCSRRFWGKKWRT